MKTIAIFASGTGSNFQNIVEAVERKELEAKIALLVCDKIGAPVVEKAKKANIPFFQFNPKEYASKADYERVILEKLREYDVEWIILAGYMRLIGPTLLASYPNKIINIHPSLLPAFPGKDAIGKAYRAKVKTTGVTIHYVDEGIDTGPIIAQQEIPIDPEDTLADLEEKIHQVEHELYPKVIQRLLSE